jgi:hypothetical protein
VCVVLFGSERQIRLVVLAGVVGIVEQVLHVEGHDGDTAFRVCRGPRHIEINTQQ